MIKLVFKKNMDIVLFISIIIALGSLMSVTTIRTNLKTITHNSKEVQIKAEVQYEELYVVAASVEDERIFYTQLVKNTRIVDATLYEASIQNVPISLSFALMEHESSYNPLAVNKNRNSIDRGLFQLNNGVYKNVPEKYFYDIEWNVNKGVNHIATELDRYQDLKLALYAYNAGPKRVNNPPLSTVKYAKEIIERKKQLEIELVQFKKSQKEIRNKRTFVKL